MQSISKSTLDHPNFRFAVHNLDDALDEKDIEESQNLLGLSVSFLLLGRRYPHRQQFALCRVGF